MVDWKKKYIYIYIYIYMLKFKKGLRGGRSTHEADGSLSIICLVFSDVPNISYTYRDRTH